LTSKTSDDLDDSGRARQSCRRRRRLLLLLALFLHVIIQYVVSSLFCHVYSEAARSPSARRAPRSSSWSSCSAVVVLVRLARRTHSSFSSSARRQSRQHGHDKNDNYQQRHTAIETAAKTMSTATRILPMAWRGVLSNNMGDNASYETKDNNIPHHWLGPARHLRDTHRHTHRRTQRQQHPLGPTGVSNGDFEPVLENRSA
jgi:hypothetical protein